MLKLEEEFWKTKYRITWLQQGDSNTRFFHTSTLNRRSNKITILYDHTGAPFTDPEQIRDHILDFYSNLYNTDYTSTLLPSTLTTTVGLT